MIRRDNREYYRLAVKRVFDDRLADARNTIIRFLVQKGTMPTVTDFVKVHKVSENEASLLYQHLHDAHALFLDADGSIRMLWPFSGIPTSFRVSTGQQSYWANCAWDAIGIAAALHTDVKIQAVVSYTDEQIELHVENDAVVPGNFLVHFPLPVAKWYDDLVYT